MRFALIGSTSFIACHVARAVRESGHDVLGLRHDESFKGDADVLVNFAIAPQFRDQPYDPAFDFDLRAAHAARDAGVRLVMLSTRRVYDAKERLDARESSCVAGDETNYGRSKAKAERAVQALVQDACILRLSNVFGFEYDPPRKTFTGAMLRSLKESGEVHFDMGPATRRDFIPVQDCARAIVAAATGHASGVFNLGSGIATRCGDAADWVMRGFGGGKLLIDDEAVKDEFCLNMSKWNAEIGPATSAGRLEECFVTLGRKLRDA
ncbi:MAG TPA: SDR family oxidoreductase [Rhizomicrobium sp.]|nr:SDR family oxidoreductase [Rhizomicrobium sp.]